MNAKTTMTAKRDCLDCFVILVSFAFIVMISVTLLVHTQRACPIANAA